MLSALVGPVVSFEPCSQLIDLRGTSGPRAAVSEAGVSFLLRKSCELRAVSCELGSIETDPPTGDTQHKEYGVVPLMAKQMPSVVSPR